MDNEFKGVLTLIIAGSLYSLYGVCSRLMSGSFAPFYQAWSRGIILILILLIVTISLKHFKTISKNDWQWFLIIGFANGFIGAFFFIAVSRLPLGIALFFFYAISTSLGYVWGSLLYKEKLILIKKISIALALLGIGLIYKDRLNLQNAANIGLLFAVGAGFFYSVYLAISKKVVSAYSHFQVALFGNLFDILLTFTISLLLKESWNTKFVSFPWLINFSYALLQAIVMPLVIYGLKNVEIQKGSLILLLELILGVVWGALIFREIPSLFAITGSVFILTGLMLPLVRLPKAILISKTDLRQFFYTRNKNKQRYKG